MLNLLAATFLTAGVIKLLRPKEWLERNIPWVEEFSSGSLKLIGAVDVLGALGLFLPEATGIAPVLTPVAATCVVPMMTGALVIHVRRNERGQIGIALFLLIMAVIVAWGRFGPYNR
jgi:uncharacterized membrane protein